MTFPKKIALLLIILIGLFFRLYGLNWDQGNHLHPDERFLTMVATDIKLPQSLSQYFDTDHSPLNPANYPNYRFFVYGTFPLFITKIFAISFHLDNYDNIVFVGRILSAFFDIGIIFILFKLTQKLLAPLIYATTILPIQLSHFFAVDTFLTFFILLTFYLLINKKFLQTGIAFGLALSCKITALYFLPIIILVLIINHKSLFTFYFLLFTFFIFRIFQPYAFSGIISLHPLFVKNIHDLSLLNIPSVYFPPSVQWLSKIKIIFPLQNIIFFGLGLPLSLSFIFIKKIKLNLLNTLSLIWIIWLVFYQGIQPVMSMRYFLPIYPFIILIVSQIIPSKFIKFFLFFHFISCFLFLTIYSLPHTRVQATDWINKNIPKNSNLSSELWDDALPLNNLDYQISTLDITGPDSPEKWQKIDDQLLSIDYIILSSNRSWASSTTVPNLLPTTNNFYQQLLSQQPLIEINSYPGIRLPLKYCYYFGPTNIPNNNLWLTKNNCLYPGIYFRDDLAEEAFTVYDHPKVLIFKYNKSN